MSKKWMLKSYDRESAKDIQKHLKANLENTYRLSVRSEDTIIFEVQKKFSNVKVLKTSTNGSIKKCNNNKP